MNNINKFINSKPFQDYMKINPSSSAEIESFLFDFYKRYKVISGIEDLLKTLADNTQGKNPPEFKWFNYFSQIRCTNYLLLNKIPIRSFEVQIGGRKLDFQLADGRLGEIKSFSTSRNSIKDPWTLDESVISEFVEKKIKPSFDNQKAHLLIIDDIFAFDTKPYRHLGYFLSFVNRPEIKDRHNLILKHLKKFLPKMLYLSFVNSITINPEIKYLGIEFKKLRLK